MSETSMTPSGGELSVGRVLSRAFELLFRDFARFFLLGGIAWLPILLLGLVTKGGAPPKLATLSEVAPLLVTMVGTMLLVFGLQLVTHAVILYGAFQEMLGRGFAIGESLAQGLSRSPAIFGMFLIMILAMVPAALLLFFPVLILLTMWYVALPVCVVEKRGPTGSLSRSSALTRGHRWKIFGIYLILAIASAIGQKITGLVFGLAGTIFAIVGTFLWSAIAGAFGAIVVAVVYHDLRVAREGIDTERIAAVFD